MRTVILVIALAFLLYEGGGHRMRSSAAAAFLMPRNAEYETLPLTTTQPASGTVPPRVDFHSQIKPILQSKCMPCHFPGGAQYTELPFDRPETIKKLGTKLFTRIQDENHRRLIREFLAQ